MILTQCDVSSMFMALVILLAALRCGRGSTGLQDPGLSMGHFWFVGKVELQDDLHSENTLLSPV